MLADVQHKRLVGLDIFRILAMTSVTSIHFICYSSIGKGFGGMPVYNQIFISFLRVFDVCFVNMFVLLSGFFLCQKVNFKGRIVSIWIETIFVTWILGCVFLFLFPECGTMPNLVRVVFPVLSGSNWYVLSYILLLMACPIYNRAIESMNRVRFRNVLLLVGFIVTIVLTANPIPNSGTFVGPSSGFAWFSYIYFIGAYLNLYENNDWGWMKQLVVLVITFIVFWWMLSFGPQLPLRSSLCDGTGIFPLLFSVELFMLMKSIVTNEECRILARMSNAAFFVYLIQINPMVSGILWKFADVNSVMNTKWLVLDWIVVQVILWIAAVMMSYVYEWSKCKFLRIVEGWIVSKIPIK